MRTVPLRWPPGVLASAAIVARKELVGILRGRAAFWGVVIAVLATSLVPLSRWPEGTGSAAAARAEALFWSYRFSVLLTLFFLAPALAAASMLGERSEGTWELLVGTPLRPAGIFLGKVLSVAGASTLVILATLPAGAAVYLLGGIAFHEVMLLLCQALELALLGAATGVAYAKGAGASSWPWFLVYFQFVGLPILLGSTPSSRLSSGVFVFGAILIIMAIVGPSLEKEPLGPWQRKAHRTLLNSVLLQKVLRLAGKHFDPELGIPDHENPILMAALCRQPQASALLAGIVSIALLILLPLGFVVTAARAFDLTGFLMGGLCLLGLVAALPGLASLLLFEERRRGILDQMRATPLGAEEVLHGKLQAALWIVSPFLLATGAALLLLFALKLLGRFSIVAEVGFLLAAPAVALVTCTAGQLAATLARTPGRAVAAAYGLSLGSLVVLPLWLGFDGGLTLSPLFGYAGLYSWNGPGGIPAFPAFFMALFASIVQALVQYLLASLLWERRWRRGD